MLYAPNGAKLTLPIVMHSTPSGRLWGVCNTPLPGTTKNEKRTTKKSGARPNLAGIPDALIFFSHPFLVSRQEKDVGVRGQRPFPRCYMRRTVKIWPFPSSCTRPHRGVCRAYSIRPYPGQQKNRERTTKKPGTRRKNPATHPAFFTFRFGAIGSLVIGCWRSK